jgi:hypothetical protein
MTDTAAPESARKRLDKLTGKWNIVITMPTEPPLTIAGRATFEWLEGGYFLAYHSEVDRPDFPTGDSIIGCDGTMGTYIMLYSDSRGVARIYEMSLDDQVWKLWRDDPSFPQRFSGTFSDDGRTITCRWEKSSDGANWELDFYLTCTKVSAG